MYNSLRQKANVPDMCLRETPVPARWRFVYATRASRRILICTIFTRDDDDDATGQDARARAPARETEIENRMYHNTNNALTVLRIVYTCVKVYLR